MAVNVDDLGCRPGAGTVPARSRLPEGLPRRASARPGGQVAASGAVYILGAV